MESYPSVLPIPRAGYAVDQDSNCFRTKMSGAYIRQRPMDVGERWEVDAEFVFSDIEWFIFASWRRYKINYGNDKFLMELELVDFLDEYECRIVGGVTPYTDENGFKVIKTKVEIYNPHYLTSEEVDLIIELGIDEVYDIEESYLTLRAMLDSFGAYP